VFAFHPRKSTAKRGVVDHQQVKPGDNKFRNQLVSELERWYPGKTQIEYRSRGLTSVRVPEGAARSRRNQRRKPRRVEPRPTLDHQDSRLPPVSSTATPHVFLLQSVSCASFVASQLQPARTKRPPRRPKAGPLESERFLPPDAAIFTSVAKTFAARRKFSVNRRPFVPASHPRRFGPRP